MPPMQTSHGPRYLTNSEAAAYLNLLPRGGKLFVHPGYQDDATSLKAKVKLLLHSHAHRSRL
jgi:hypothetical protein